MAAGSRSGDLFLSTGSRHGGLGFAYSFTVASTQRPREFNHRACNSRVVPDITFSRENVPAIIIMPFRIYIDTNLNTVSCSL